MRKVLGLVGATLLFAGSASAADLLKAPAMPLGGPLPSWTGWYIGATAGYGWSNQGIDEHVNSTFCNPAANGCQGNAVSNSLAVAIPPHLSTNPKGFIGGGEFGYNHQLGQFVLGVEGDVSGADIKGSDSRAQTAGIVGFPNNSVSVAAAADQKLDFFATLRGRFGFLVTPSLLAYGTAGFAFGHVSANSALAEAVGGACIVCPPTAVAASSSATLPGWTAGGGLEWLIAPQWSVKGEYLYYNLGTLSTTLPQLTQTSNGLPFFGANVSSSAVVKGNIARVGVNFHF